MADDSTYDTLTLIEQKRLEQKRLESFIALSKLLLDESNLDPALAAVYLKILTDQSPQEYGPGDSYTCYLLNSTSADSSSRNNASPNNVNGQPLDIMFDMFNQLKDAETPNLLNTLTGLYAADSTLAPIAQNLVLLWYNGYLNNQYPPARFYQQALVWQVIGANPPGITGPYYGSWGYPPEQSIHTPEEGGDYEGV